jgi:hypothetical protein
MTRRATRAPRALAAPAATLVLAAAALVGGCSVTTNTSKCVNNECEVSLNGDGADADLDTLAGEPTVTLEGASDGTADLSVDGEDVSCREGETVEAAGLSIECTDVGDDEVDLQVTG